MAGADLDIDKLSVEERLNLIARLCESLDEHEEALGQPTAEQWAEIDRRLKRLENNPQSTVTWSQILQRIAARRA